MYVFLYNTIKWPYQPKHSPSLLGFNWDFPIAGLHCSSTITPNGEVDTWAANLDVFNHLQVSHKNLIHDPHHNHQESVTDNIIESFHFRGFQFLLQHFSARLSNRGRKMQPTEAVLLQPLKQCIHVYMYVIRGKGRTGGGDNLECPWESSLWTPRCL